MLYVKRNEQGKVLAVSKDPAPGFVASDGNISRDVADFLSESGQLSDLAASDLDFVRVLDDLLQVLMEKGVLNFTDMPPEAQRKLVERDQLRKAKNALDVLLDDDGST